MAAVKQVMIGRMFYAERLGDMDAGEEYIEERGVFMSLDEFVPYRRKGWSGTPATDAAADALIADIDTAAALLGAVEPQQSAHERHYAAHGSAPVSGTAGE